MILEFRVWDLLGDHNAAYKRHEAAACRSPVSQHKDTCLILWAVRNPGIAQLFPSEIYNTPKKVVTITHDCNKRGEECSLEAEYILK